MYMYDEDKKAVFGLMYKIKDCKWKATGGGRLKDWSKNAKIGSHHGFNGAREQMSK